VHHDRAEDEDGLATERVRQAGADGQEEQRLGFGRIVASEIEAPNMLPNLV
jgi:hypothetical protein